MWCFQLPPMRGTKWRGQLISQSSTEVCHDSNEAVGKETIPKRWGVTAKADKEMQPPCHLTSVEKYNDDVASHASQPAAYPA